MSLPFYILTPNDLNMFYEGQQYLCDNTHPNWKEIILAIRQKQFNHAAELIDITEQVAKHIEAQPEEVQQRLVINKSEGTVKFDGINLGSRSTNYVISVCEEKSRLAPVLMFFDRLSKNPSYRAREQTLEFILSNGMPLSEDGRFLAYKRITADWKDVHSKKISNAIGATPNMNRAHVDDDPSRTCSSGLHVCSQRYLRNYTGKRLVAVAVDPKDVVCVPNDYQSTKMRVCAYEVLAELPINLIQDKGSHWDTHITTMDDDWEEDEDEDEDEDEEPEIVKAFVVVDKEENPAITPGRPLDDWVTYDETFAEIENFYDHEFHQIWLCDVETDSSDDVNLIPITKVL